MAEDDSRVHNPSEVHKRRAPVDVRPAPKSETNAESAVGSVRNATGEAAVDAVSGGGELQARAGGSHASGDHAAGAPASDDANVASSGVSSRRGHAFGESENEEPAKRKRWGLRIAIAAVCLIIAAALVSAGYYAGSRWLRYNDEHDLEGTWYASGTDVAISLSDGSIVFDSDTAYSYEVDPTAKTIRYSLGSLEGQGRYWFSADRSTLIITDGSDYTMWSTFFDDLAYDASCLFGNKELPVAESSIVLTREIALDGKAEGAEPDGSAAQRTQEAAESGEGEDGSGEGAGDAGGAVDGKPGKKEGFGDLAISDVLAEEGEPDYE